MFLTPALLLYLNLPGWSNQWLLITKHKFALKTRVLLSSAKASPFCRTQCFLSSVDLQKNVVLLQILKLSIYPFTGNFFFFRNKLQEIFAHEVDSHWYDLRLHHDFTVVSVLEQLETGLEVLECLLPSYFKVFLSNYTNK